MNYNQTATQIIALIGGKENVSHLEHCSTRLRFTLKDDSLVKVKALESVEGVIGVRQNSQCQVIIGNDIIEVYDQVVSQLGSIADSKEDVNLKNKKWGVILLDFIISIFQPLVPAIAGGGILKSLLLLISVLGLISTKQPTYQLLNLVAGAPLYFLPILVAITTANKLKVNQLVAVSVVGALILPDLTTLLATGTKFMGFGIENVAYASQVFPAILAVLFYAQVEHFFTKFSPKPIRIFFVPMMCLLITVPVTLLILGPLGYNIGTVLSTGIVWLYSHLGWLATALLAAFLPFMVVTGMHLTLADHLSFATERQKKGLTFTNRLQWELETYYENEFKVGRDAIDLLSDKYQYKFPDEEAANIAFHIINAQDELSDESNGFKKAKLVSSIINLVKYASMCELNTASIHYNRFLIHVRYFADRFFSNLLIDEADGLYKQMWHLYPIEMGIALRIAEYIMQTYQIKVPESELAYLGVHINRLIQYSSNGTKKGEILEK